MVRESAGICRWRVWLGPVGLENGRNPGNSACRVFCHSVRNGLGTAAGSLRFCACGVEGFVRQREDLCVFFVGRGETQVRGHGGQAEGRDWSCVSAG